MNGLNYDGMGYDEYYDEHPYDPDDMFYDELEVQPQTVRDTWTYCIQPSIAQISSYVATFLIWNFIFRITTTFLPVPVNVKHFFSITCGGAILYLTMGVGSCYVFVLALTIYSILIGVQKLLRQHYGYVVAAFTIIYLVIGELSQINAEQWHKLRGAQMVMVMKGISIGFDVDSKKISQLPNFLESIGYLLCPSNSSLGPWIPYSEYVEIFKKNRRNSNFHWAYWIFVNVLISVICVLCSNCLIAYFIADSSWKWITAYRDAMSYRFSHYFVTFLSQSMMLMGGYQEEQNKVLGYTITKPWQIEVPRSLVGVVVVWNISMHRWLKAYVFRTLRKYGAFKAILSTYVISTLLHGLSFPIAAVLLTLGIATYVEYRLRKSFATVFDACLLANSCNQNCNHRHKWRHPAVLTANVFFGILAMVHLTYLGVMFDAFAHADENGFSYQDTLDKWSSLYFLGHWLIFAFYILYYFIEN
ncbi:protein-serine O-palmitoleoyltransferase porcupine [Bradysia coprophila]|uniref:protein-serine O-palmitoleoyltransferase porcupine n=1 Tax=Bradysia coprophila TaxID=38358 RepID=UPI00187D8FB7|nr:protein-serine O-palmitoleoyltransferase porcupine [Bradysia coprophila]